MTKVDAHPAIGITPPSAMIRIWNGPTTTWRMKAMPCVWELAALVTRYEWCMSEGDALTPTDLAAAVENYWQAADIKDLIYGEATRFRVPLPYTGCWQDDLRTVRAFIAGGGWQ